MAPDIWIDTQPHLIYSLYLKRPKIEIKTQSTEIELCAQAFSAPCQTLNILNSIYPGAIGYAVSH